MKKVLIIIVLFVAVLAVNAQTLKTTDTLAVNAQTTNITDTQTKGVRTPVMVADLLKPITDNIAKDYVGYTIKEANSVTKNNIVTYHVVIVKDVTTMTLVYDKDGLFVKKISPTMEKK
jgi:hypothetical protein